MKLAIVGSRSFQDMLLLDKILSEAPFNSMGITCIVSGAAAGADNLARQYAKKNKLMLIEFPADWLNKGRYAGYLRNMDIIQTSDVVLVFWDGVSKGTRHSIDLAQQHKKVLYVVQYLRAKPVVKCYYNPTII